MSKEKSNFISWKQVKKGNATFENNSAHKIVGKWIFILDNGRGKAKDVLFVYGMKQNLLNLSHICDWGYDLLFKAKNYQLKSLGTREIVVEAIRI